MNQKKGIGGILLIGGAALLVAAVLSVGVGSTAIPPSDVIRSILAACGLLTKDAVDPSVYAAVSYTHLPTSPSKRLPKRSWCCLYGRRK